MKTRLAFLIFCGVPLFAQTVVGLPNSSGGGGGGSSSAGAISCVGTPGNTVGSYRQQCQTAAGAIYACNNAGGCTVAADWAAVPFPPAYTAVTFVAAGMTLTNTGAAIQGYTYTMTANMTGASTFSPALTTGQVVYLKPCQDGTGSRTNMYPAIVTGAGPVTPNPGFCTTQAFQYDGANLNPLSGAVTNDTNGVIGNIDLQLGYRYGCTHGTNGTCGVATLSTGTVTVSTTAIGALAAAGGAGYSVELVLQSCSSCGILSVGTVTAGTSFVINSSNGADASKVYWEIKHVN